MIHSPMFILASVFASLALLAALSGWVIPDPGADLAKVLCGFFVASAAVSVAIAASDSLDTK